VSKLRCRARHTAAILCLLINVVGVVALVVLCSAYGGPGVQLVRATCELRNGQRSYKKEVFDADPKAIVAMVRTR